MVTERELLEAVLDAREVVEKWDAELQIAKEKKESAERSFIERLDATETKSIKLETNRGLVLAVRKEALYVSVDKANQDELLVWIDEGCGRSDMIKRTVHNKTLESFVKERIKAGEQIPPYIKFFPKPILAISMS